MEIRHDPAAMLPYAFDWAAPDLAGRTWIGDDTIATADVTSTDDTAIISNVTHDSGKVTAWVTGGTPGKPLPLNCHITTTDGRTDERTLWLRVQER